MVGGGQSGQLCSPSRKVDIMNRALAALRQLAWKTDGQDLLEYGLLVALIAIVAIGAVGQVGQTIYSVFWRDIGNAI
jgi:Flp pilus assembly pilin Flp